MYVLTSILGRWRSLGAPMSWASCQIGTISSLRSRFRFTRAFGFWQLGCPLASWGSMCTPLCALESDENGHPPLSITSYGALPLGTRMLQVRNDNLLVPSLGFIPIVNLSHVSGLIYAETVAMQGHPMFFLSRRLLSFDHADGGWLCSGQWCGRGISRKCP